jgi:hypothetical protein
MNSPQWASVFNAWLACQLSGEIISRNALIFSTIAKTSKPACSASLVRRLRLNQSDIFETDQLAEHAASSAAIWQVRRL